MGQQDRHLVDTCRPLHTPTPRLVCFQVCPRTEAGGQVGQGGLRAGQPQAGRGALRERSFHTLIAPTQVSCLSKLTIGLSLFSTQVLKRLGLLYEGNPSNLDSAFQCYRRMRELYLRHLGHMDVRTREAMR